MIAIQRRTSQHHLMRVERRRRDGGGAVVLQEIARVRLQCVQERAVEVEDVYVVAFGAPVR